MVSSFCSYTQGSTDNAYLCKYKLSLSAESVNVAPLLYLFI